ncbi:hypothetical protein PTKIN_Ptkin05aG0122800 [Pterospermum kingtungense]
MGMYDGQVDDLMSNVENPRKFSFVWRSIIGPMMNDDQFSEFMYDNSSLAFSNGSKIGSLGVYGYTGLLVGVLSCVLQTLLLVRNDMVFNGISLVLEKVINLCKLIIAMWCEAKWPMLVKGVNEIVRNPIMVCLPIKTRRYRGYIKRSPPAHHVFKFNVDGAIQELPGFASIGGVLRDSARKFEILFSKAIGVVDSNLAELIGSRSF